MVDVSVGSTFDDQCVIMLLYLLKTLIPLLYVNCAEGLHFSAFILFNDVMETEEQQHWP